MNVDIFNDLEGEDDGEHGSASVALQLVAGAAITAPAAPELDRSTNAAYDNPVALMRKTPEGGGVAILPGSPDDVPTEHGRVSPSQGRAGFLRRADATPTPLTTDAVAARHAVGVVA